MESLYLLIPIAMVFLIVALIVFFWSVRSGQFDDLGSQGQRILFDEPNEMTCTADDSAPKERDFKDTDSKDGTMDTPSHSVAQNTKNLHGTKDD